jgi:hypothetical protein
MEKMDYQKHLLAPDGSINPEVDPIRSAYELTKWLDDATADDIETVASGFKYYITEITIQNLGAASVVSFYDAAKGDQAEANWKYAVDAKATDTTVVTGIMLVFATAVSTIASVCAAAHDVKIHMSGYKVKT